MRIFEFEAEHLYICYAQVAQIVIENYTDEFSEHRMKKLAKLKKEDVKQECAGAELMLNHAVRRCLPEVKVPVNYSVSENGKPYFTDLSDKYFSLSHSGGVAVCAISDFSVGIDIQKTGTYKESIAARFFSREEQRLVQDADSFTRIWARKEAAVKAEGRGLAAGLSGFDAGKDRVELGGRIFRISDIPVRLKGYHMAAAMALP